MEEKSEKGGTKITDFYKEKSILITGASGFLGVILLEALLRLCPGVKQVYVLLRTKKGIPPEVRKDVLFQKSVFDKLKRENPSALSKIRIVAGDVSLPDFGLTSSDLQNIVSDVSVVFHCAASISFLKPLKYILEHNALSTQYAIDLCRKLHKLDAFVYTSTAFANSNRKIVMEEEILFLPFSANKFVDEIKNGDDKKLHFLFEQCQPPWPNYYTFSKCLSENIIAGNASDLPVAIIRPSLIACVVHEPLPGYVEDTSGITALSIGTGKGFVKVLHADPQVIFDYIPADICAHAHIIAAEKIATERPSTPLVINCTSYGRIALQDYMQVMLDLVKTNPLPKAFRTPTVLKLIKNPLLYELVAAYEHYMPAYAMDLLLKMAGKKPKLVSIYRFVDDAISSTSYFMKNWWIFKTDKFEKLMLDVSPEDKKIFCTNTKGNGFIESVKDIPTGGPFWNWEIDEKNIPQRMEVAQQRYWLTIFIQALFWVFVACFAYYVFTDLTK